MKKRKNKGLLNLFAKEVRSRKYRPQVIQSKKLYNRKKLKDDKVMS